MRPLTRQESPIYAQHSAPTCFVWGKVGRLWASRPSAAGTGLIAILSPTPPPRNTRGVSSQARRCNTFFKDVAICSTEDLLATVDNRGNVVVFHVSANRYNRLGHAGPSGTCVRFSTSSRALLVSGHCDGRIRCFNANTGAALGTLRGHRTAVKWLDFKPGSGELASTSQDCVIVWHMRTMIRKRTLGADSSKGGGFCAGRYLQEGSKLVTSCRDGSFLVWESKSFALLGRARAGECSRPVKDCCQDPAFCVSPDGKWLVCSKDHPSLLVCEIASCTFCYGLKLDGKKGMGVRAMEFMPDSQTVVVLGKDGGLRFVELKTGKVCYKVLDQGNGKEGDKFSITPRAQLLALTVEPGKVYLYDMSKVRGRGPPVPEQTVERVLFKNSENINEFLSQPVVVDNSNKEATSNTVSTSKLINWAPDAATGSRGVERKISRSNSKAALPSARTREIDPSQLRIATLGLHENQLNRSKLQDLLHSFGEYPEKYRLLIWEFLLEIPQNSCAFEIIANKGLHPAFKHLKERFPCLDKATLGRLSKTLSSLAHWCPLFGEVTFLPSLVFPLVKLFGHSEETCFEIVASVLLNWARTWFQEFPRPPMHILAELESLLLHHDSQISSALSSFNGGVGRVLWTTMSTLMSEVVSRQDWLKLWDHVITNDPTFLYFLLISHLIYFKQSLMAFQTDEDIEAFVHTPKPSDINKIILQAYALQAGTPDHLKPATQGIKGLGNSNVYPEFTLYPHSEIGWMSKERVRIQSEEDALLRRRWVLQELESQTVKLEAQMAHNWMDTLQAKQLAEQESQKQRDALRTQGQEVLAQKARLDDRVKQERIKQIAIMEDSYRLGIENMQSEMNCQVSKEKEEIAYKKEVLVQDLRAAKEEEKINMLEFQSQQRLLNLHNEILKQEARKRVESEARTRLASVEASQTNKLEGWRAKDKEEDARRRLEAIGRSEVTAIANENVARLDVEEALRKAEIEQEAQLLKIENERFAQQRAFEEVERAQKMMEEERKRGEILAIQDQAILRAQAEEDSAWFEKEKVIKEELIFSKKAARQEEELARHREQLEQERHSKLHQAEIDLLVRRREMERALLSKEQDAQRFLRELKKERYYEKLGDTEMLKRQKELEERVKHAMEVSKLQVEVEAQERAKIIQGKMAADEAMCHQQADVQQKHQEIMSKLALERERQLLELDTAWRKQVRIEETAQWEEERSKFHEEKLKIKAEHLTKERDAAKEVADIRREAQFAKFKLDPKERLLTSQLLSDDDTICSLTNSNKASKNIDKTSPKAKAQARARNPLFSSGASSNLEGLLPQFHCGSEVVSTNKSAEVGEAQSAGEVQSIDGGKDIQVWSSMEHAMFDQNDVAQKHTSYESAVPRKWKSTFETQNMTIPVHTPALQTVQDSLTAYERKAAGNLSVSKEAGHRADVLMDEDRSDVPKSSGSSPRSLFSNDIAAEERLVAKPITGDSFLQRQNTTPPKLYEASEESNTTDTNFMGKGYLQEPKRNQVSTAEIKADIISRHSFSDSKQPQSPLSAVPEESASRSSTSAAHKDSGLSCLQATRSRISALLDEVLGTDSPTNAQNDGPSLELTEYARSKDFDQMMQELKLDEPSSPDIQNNNNIDAGRGNAELPSQLKVQRYSPSYRSQSLSPIQISNSGNSSFDLGQSQDSLASAQISPSKKATWMQPEEDSLKNSVDRHPIRSLASPIRCTWESDTVIESVSYTKSNDLLWNVKESNHEARDFSSYSSSLDEMAKGIQDCPNTSSIQPMERSSNTSSTDLDLHALTSKNSKSEFGTTHSALKNAMDSLQQACTRIQMDRSDQDGYF